MSYKLLINRLAGSGYRASFARCQTTRLYSSKPSDSQVEIPENPLKELHSATYQTDNGAVYDKKPFRMMCEEGKVYIWCLCGHSKRQPFCDGTHNNIFMKVKLKPVKFTVKKTGEYWLCNCKHTSNRPFCDGTHKREDLEKKKY